MVGHSQADHTAVAVAVAAVQNVDVHFVVENLRDENFHHQNCCHPSPRKGPKRQGRRGWRCGAVLLLCVAVC